jgi:hypothetical protein
MMLAGKQLPDKQKKAGKRQNVTKDGKFVVTTDMARTVQFSFLKQVFRRPLGKIAG